MSFSFKVKKEISNVRCKDKTEALIELSAICHLSSSIIFNNQGTKLLFLSETEEVIDRVIRLFEYIYAKKLLKTSKVGNRGVEVFRAELDEKLSKTFLEHISTDEFGKYIEDEDKIFSRLSTDRKKYAYLRGAFLGGGSITDPKKSYHFEISMKRQEDLHILLVIFEELGIEASYIIRDKIILYLKNSEKIIDLLAICEAFNSLLLYEDARALKSLRNKINRKTNAETANLSKIAKASLTQIQAIKNLKNSNQYSYLNDKLKDLCEKRLKFPQASLLEIGEMYNPKISKSTINNRLKKIIEISKIANKK